MYRTIIVVLRKQVYLLNFMTRHFVCVCISKLKGHTILKIAHMDWECSINLISKSLTYRSAPEHNLLFVNQFFGSLIYSGKFVNWAYDFQSIRRWILCPLIPEEKLIWIKRKSSSASRIADWIVAFISLMLLYYPTNNSCKDLRAQTSRQK